MAVNNDITLPLYGYIELTRGVKTLVDWEDVEFLNQWLWLLSSRGYAVRSYRYKDNSGKSRKHVLSMHRVIMERHGYEIEGLDVDHINRDRLCNIKSNLRVATRSQNLINKSISARNTSGAVGVHYRKNTNKWEAILTINSKQVVLGRFSSKEDAIKARKEGLIKYFGEYANLDENIPQTPSISVTSLITTDYVPRGKKLKKTP